jgi:hypothetical protein
MHVAIAVTGAVDLPRCGSDILAVGGTLAIVRVVDAEHPFHASDHASDDAADHRSDRSGRVVAHRCSVHHASGYALGECGHWHCEHAKERACDQDLVVHRQLPSLPRRRTVRRRPRQREMDWKAAIA